MSMNGAIQTTSIPRARRKLFQALRPFRVSLDEVVDPDVEIWEEMKKEYERVQEELFKKRFPRLYAKIARQ